MLNIKNVAVTYPERDILKNISFSLNKGETIAIIGPSGCGKSTLLLALAGLKSISNGEISNTFSDSGLILQNHGLFPWKTVKKNLLLGLKSRKYCKEKMELKINEITTQLKINHLLHQYPNQLSGGEKQRVAVARVLVYNPELLLLDEPSSALDSLNKRNFQSLLLQIQKKYGMSYIIVTHDIEEAVFLGQKVFVMQDGEIKSVIENQCYHQVDRKSYDFFDKCNEVRSELEKFGVIGDE
ncbi:MAG TPA: ABC transporter ATP-binding protein [Firmicutes bacterium]|nr:ABC transporter ATP-binding protein [Bacillota bacterium]